jgi:hypothetical protein
MNQTPRIRAILLLLFVSLTLGSCSLFNSDTNPSDVIENGPFDYTLRGMAVADIDCGGYSLISQWAELGDPGEISEVQAGLHASFRDTVANIVQWQRYNIIFVRKNEWPGKGLYTVTDIADVRRGGSDQFYIFFNSLYRENGLGDTNHILVDDFGAFAESGSIEITTSDEASLRGTFSLDLSLTERRTWNGSEETVETSFSEQLEAEGAFDIDLTKNKVSIVSSVPNQEFGNMCEE